MRYNMLQYAIRECCELHRWLEEEFNPLQLCEQVNQTFAVLREHEEYEEYSQYVESLQVAIVRLVKQVKEGFLE